MLQSKSTVGLLLIVAAVVITRVAVHYVYPPPGMPTAEIWRMMSVGPKLIVIASFIMFSYGSGTVIGAIRRRLGKG